MLQKNFANIERRWKTRTYTVILLAIIFSTSLISDVFAQGQTVTVRLLIEESFWNDCDDGPLGGPPEIYYDVYIDGVRRSSFDDPIYVNIAPFAVGKEFSVDVDVSKQNISIVIQEWDDDGGATGDNDKCDIDPGGGRDLDLNLDLATCQISGDASGVCGTSIIIAQGTGWPSWFKFKITLQEPPHAPGLNLRCMHSSPIPGQPNTFRSPWPQPGDQVTITAQALDGNANLMPGIVNDIEIWVDNTAAAAISTATTPGSFGANSLTFNHTPPPGATQVLYRCRANAGGFWVSSGWHLVQIGQPATGRAVPILYTGVPDSRLDIVFIADRNDYPGGSNDPQFLTDVRTAINDAYYANRANIRNGGRTFLLNQDAINFWIALDTGAADDANTCGSSCNHSLPSQWESTYSFADSGAIVNRTIVRDFAERDKRIFSANVVFAFDNFLHELGHSPIGLSDEYCCDSYYFESEPYPNIYSERADCVDDPLTIGFSDACQKIQTLNWYRVESAATLGNDLMDDTGDHASNLADERQINWYFNQCRGGTC